MEKTYDPLTTRFIQALGQLERDSRLEELVALYRDDAKIGNVLEPLPLQGRNGARNFWTMYRNTFREVRSSFRNVLADERRAALEWTCEAKGRHGQPIKYEGVTVLEFQDGLITRSWAYFDGAGLGAQLRQPEIVPFDPGA
jgi:predicted ester cyclase